MCTLQGYQSRTWILTASVGLLLLKKHDNVHTTSISERKTTTHPFLAHVKITSVMLKLGICFYKKYKLNNKLKWTPMLRRIRPIIPHRENMYLLINAPNEDTNQPAQTCSVSRVFVVCMMKRSILGYLKCAQWRFWSDCANAQADLNLHWARMTDVTFSDVAALFILSSTLFLFS